MVECANALRYEQSEQLDLLIRPDGSMNSGRENDGDVAWLNSVLDQPPNQEVDDLRAVRRTRGIRHNDQNCITGRNQLFQKR